MAKMIKYGTAVKFVDYAEEQNPFENLEGKAYEPDELTDSVARNAYIRYLGWQIPIIGLKLYVVKTKYGGYLEMYAPNKTFVRKYLSGYGDPVVGILDTGKES